MRAGDHRFNVWERRAIAAIFSCQSVAIAGPVRAAESRTSAPPDSRKDQTVAVLTSNEPQKTETSGLGLSAGIGSQYPYVGIQAAYYLQVPHSLFRITPYAGIGGAICTGAARADCVVGETLGAMVSWGHRHRILADAFYGPVLAYSLSFHGEDPKTQASSGIGLAGGYEYMAASGFFLRADLGVAYAFGPPIKRPKDRFAPTLTLIGIGYKFW